MIIFNLCFLQILFSNGFAYQKLDGIANSCNLKKRWNRNEVIFPHQIIGSIGMELCMECVFNNQRNCEMERCARTEKKIIRRNIKSVFFSVFVREIVFFCPRAICIMQPMMNESLR